MASNKQHLRNVLLLVLALTAGFSALLAAHVVTVEGIWFVFPITNIRISTLATAFFAFGLVLFLQGRIRWKPLYYALLAVIFFMGLYEIVWYYIAASIFHYDWRIFEFAALAGWIVLAIREVYQTKPPKLSIALYALFVLGMVFWVATGFKVNNLGQPEFSVAGEVLNETSKIALALGFAFHIGTKRN